MVRLLCYMVLRQGFRSGYGVEAAKTLPIRLLPDYVGPFSLNANPKRGDIVIFKHNGEFTHTGIVMGVNGDYFTTIEGNTSSGSTIIANGGAVCKKGYYNSNLPGTKFCRPDYDLVEEDIDMDKLNELAARVEKLEKPMIYNYIDKNMPEWARPTVQKLVDKGFLKGDGGGLGLTDELLRILVINDRAGLYDRVM